jgi:hypothetical protein
MTPSEWQLRISDFKRNSGRYPPWELLDDLATESESVSTWEGFQQWYSMFQGHWCFRGHRMANWFLIPSLERERRLVSAEVGDRIHETYSPLDSRAYENSLREKFRHGANINVADPLPWMQHYSTPTTLMDWSYSPYVALYFALEKEPSEESAVWAIDLDWLEKRSGKRPLHAVVSEKPTLPNPRIIAQQGLFLRKVSEERTFSECLLGMVLEPPIPNRQVVSKLVLKRQQRKMLLEKLDGMGICHDSIYPGPESLDDLGQSLSKSLRTSLEAEAGEFKKSLVERMESRKGPS